MKKFLKKTEGFTLVELIVVIAILGILAGIAIPAYSNYITKANDSKVIVELDAIATAAQAANAEKGEITSIIVGTDGKTITVAGASATNFNSDFMLFYGCTDKTTTDGTKFDSDTAFIDLAKSSYEGKGANWTPAKGWNVGTTLPA